MKGSRASSKTTILKKLRLDIEQHDGYCGEQQDGESHRLSPEYQVRCMAAPDTGDEMSTHSFVEVRKWVADVAEAHDVKLSNRKCKAVAAEWMTTQQIIEDIGDDISILDYKDSTGDAAVKRILTLIVKG